MKQINYHQIVEYEYDSKEEKELHIGEMKANGWILFFPECHREFSATFQLFEKYN